MRACGARWLPLRVQMSLNSDVTSAGSVILQIRKCWVSGAAGTAGLVWARGFSLSGVFPDGKVAERVHRWRGVHSPLWAEQGNDRLCLLPLSHSWPAITRALVPLKYPCSWPVTLGSVSKCPSSSVSGSP